MNIINLSFNPTEGLDSLKIKNWNVHMESIKSQRRIEKQFQHPQSPIAMSIYICVIKASLSRSLVTCLILCNTVQSVLSAVSHLESKCSEPFSEGRCLEMPVQRFCRPCLLFKRSSRKRSMNHQDLILLSLFLRLITGCRTNSVSSYYSKIPV